MSFLLIKGVKTIGYALSLENDHDQALGGHRRCLF